MNMIANPENFNGLVSEALKADSRVIADRFEKRHTEVLRAIRDLIEKSEDWGLRNFASFKNNDLTGESTSHYEMTRDGYSMLVMGFTGKKAMDWKIKFLAAFNAMEARLRQSAPVTMTGKQLMAAALIEADATIKAQTAQIEAMQSDVDALGRLAKADGSMCFRDAAKSLQVRPGDLTQHLATNRWIYRQSQNGPWLAYQDKIASGYLEHKVTTIDRSDGTEKAVTQCRITAKGLAKLAKMIGGAA